MIINLCGPYTTEFCYFINVFHTLWPGFIMIDEIFNKESLLNITKFNFENVDNLINKLKEYKEKNDNIIICGGFLDLLVNVLYSKEKNDKIMDDLSVYRIINKFRMYVSYYDIIFYVNTCYDDNQKNKRNEIRNIYEMFIKSYNRREGDYFPLYDCPAIIEIRDKDVPSIIENISLYLSKEGTFFKPEQN